MFFNNNFPNWNVKLNLKSEFYFFPAGSAQELREMESRVSSLTSRNLELESTNTALSRRVEDILKEMEDAAKNFRSDMARKVSQIETFLSLSTLFITFLT